MFSYSNRWFFKFANSEAQLSTPTESSKLSSTFIVEDIVPTLPEKMKRKGKNERKQERLVGKHHKSIEHEQLGRQKALFHNLLVYLDVCVSNEMIPRGLNTLLNYRMRCKNVENRMNVINIELYNVLLSGYAAKANVDKLRYLMTILKEDAIQANHQTYASLFEGLMRAKTEAKSSEESNKFEKMLFEYKDQASSMGITLNDIITKSQFVRDQRKILLNALRLLEPNFNPVYKPPATHYDNVLLNELNAQVRPLEESVATRVSYCFSYSGLLNITHKKCHV